MTDQSLPGTAVDLPPVPELAETFGYRGDARYVALSWTPFGDEVVVDDGRTSGTGESWAFLSFKRHRVIAPLLADADLGSSEESGTEALMIDRERQRASIAFADEAREFLRAQWPPAPPLTEEQREAIRQEFERLLREREQQPIDWSAVQQQMQEQQGRVKRMQSWLDQCPLPEHGPDLP